MSQPDLEILLVPGFFGFSSIGRMSYFAHVQAVLETGLRARGLEPRIHEATPPPTGSLERRSSHLAGRLAQICAHSDAPVHLIGHSTGGLDARMLLSPGVKLPGVLDLDQLTPRVRSVTTISTPHHGAPLARTLRKAQGERLLALLSIMTLHVVRLNTVAVLPLQVLLRSLTATGNLLDLEPGLIDSVWEDVLSDFDPGRQGELRSFFAEVRQDRSLIPQLTPEGLDRVRDSLNARATVRYGNVVTRARAPTGLPVPLPLPGQATYQLYKLLHHLSGWTDRDNPPDLPAPALALAAEVWGTPPRLGTNDGIVPTQSMFWGSTVHLAWADHLDCLGFFTGPECAPPHVDWIRTGTGFNRAGFEAMWGNVADFILRAQLG